MKIGDYVRTDIGEIRKVVRVTDDLYVLDKDVVFAHKDKIKKSSPNIIDLIEVGDILYLEESDDIACMFFRDVYLVKNEDNLLHIIDEIKNKKCRLLSIVTKEQFESMQYKVESKGE